MLSFLAMIIESFLGGLENRKPAPTPRHYNTNGDIIANSGPEALDYWQRTHEGANPPSGKVVHKGGGVYEVK